VTKQRAKNRSGHGRGSGTAPAAKGTKPATVTPAKKARQSHPRTPGAKRRGPVGRPDGPLARRRRFRVRLLLVLLLVVNVAAGVTWRDWSVSLAVLIVSVITAPLLAALLLRRR
jgi:hypothetical protein